MDTKQVKDLMLPLSDYAVVSQDATVAEALDALKTACDRIPMDLQPPRAVLAVDENQNVIGQLGHLEFLKALEPKYGMFGNLEVLSKADLSTDFITSMMENYCILQDSLSNLCRTAMSVKVQKIMRSVSDSIDENAPLTEAIHKMVMWQSMRILVTRLGKVVGILRLADLFAEVSSCIDQLKQQAKEGA